MNNTANRGRGIFLLSTITDQLNLHSITLYSTVNVIIIKNLRKCHEIFGFTPCGRHDEGCAERDKERDEEKDEEERRR